MNKILICLIFIFISSNLFSQIKGLVKDEKGIVMANANIIILDSLQEIEAFAITNKLGGFEITDFKLGNKTIQIKKPTFSQYEEEIVIGKQDFDLGIFTLVKDNSIILKEVIVKSTDNFYKKDTTEFEAAKYRTGKELNVEDLIKSIPGVTVDKDGKIKIGKKNVQSVLVEGDDLFDRGYALLTQAMNDQSVVKIQIINNHTKNQLTKDIYNSDALAINLILDEKAKNQWNGNALVSSTSYVENPQQLRLNLMNFSKKRKIITLFNYNTIGFDEMKGVDYLIKNQFSTAYNFDQLSDVKHLPNLANLYQDNYQFEDNRTNFNNDKIGVVNFINNFKKSKIQILGIYNRIEKNNYIDEIENYNDNEIQFINNQNSQWNKKIDNYFVKIEWNKDLTKKSNLNITNRSFLLNERNANNFLFNNSSIFLKGSNETNSTDTQLIYTNKIDSVKLITIVAKHLYQNRPYDFIETNPIFRDVFNNQDLLNLKQKINNRQNYIGLKSSFFNKVSKKGNYFVTLGMDYQSVNLTSNYRGFNESFSKIFLLDNSANHLEYDQNKMYLILGIERKWKSFEFKSSLPILYFSTLIKEDLSSKENNFFVSPKIEFSYEKRKFGKISFSYNYQITPTSFDAYYQELIYKGNRQFSKNNILEYNIFGGSLFNVNYSKSKGMNNGFEFSLMYQIQNKTIGYNSTFNSNYSVNEQIIVDGIEIINPSFMYKYFIYPIKTKIQFNSNYSIIKSTSIANENLIRNQFSSLVFGMEVKSGFTSFLNYELGAKLSINKSKNQLNSYNYNNIDVYTNVYFNLSKQITLDINYEYYNFGGQNQMDTNFLDMKLVYQLKNSKMKFFVKGNNLFNTKEIKRTLVTPVTERYFTQRLLPLHILLGMNINF
ncbi:carboxypeptidase-like regulatory domain-containing protein [Empedobacter falsenii]